MKNRILIISVSAVILLALIITVCMFVYNRQSVFNGDRVKNPDMYLMEFTRMNQTDSHSLVLNAGDSLYVEYEITKGNADITIGKADADEVYRGNGINEGNFSVTVPDSGAYIITVKAENATGRICVKSIPAAAEK